MLLYSAIYFRSGFLNLKLLMIKLFALLTILVATLISYSQDRTIVFTHVTVIDMASDHPTPNMTVIVSGNRIDAIGRKLKVPKNAETIDATGKFLMPGLWDNYTYTLEAVKNKYPFFEMMLANGVTGVRDVGTSMDLNEAAKLRADINAGRVLTPRLFYAGTVLLGEMPQRRSARWTGISTVVATPEAARVAVENLARAGVDHIKVEKRTTPELLKVIIQTAHMHNLPVVAVPPSFVLDASNDGLNCVEHFAEFFRETSNKRNEYYALYRDHKIDSMSKNENYAFFGTMETDLPYYKKTVKALARNGTCVITNTAMTSTFIGDFEFVDVSRRRFKSREQIRDLEAAIAERNRQIGNNDYRMSGKNRERHLRQILELHRAGVLILAGTQSAYDSDSVGTPGIILHDELALFVQSGLSPFEALKTATINPALFMHREKDLGTIEKGKLADMVLLDANPLTDISNTRKIYAVVANGRYLSRDALDGLLSHVEVWAKGQ